MLLKVIPHNRKLNFLINELLIHSTTENWTARSATQLQPDGSPALAAECELVLVGVCGIEDPLRDEVHRTQPTKLSARTF